MPVVARPPREPGVNPEPPVVVNPDPPIMPGRGTDVDPHQRVENVGTMVATIPIEPESPDLTGFLAFAQQRSSRPAVRGVPGTPVGWVAPVPVDTGRVHPFEDGGDRYMVINFPAASFVLGDGRFVSAGFGDTVEITLATAQRALDTGTIKPL
jgi:hypothetical protein